MRLSSKAIRIGGRQIIPKRVARRGRLVISAAAVLAALVVLSACVSSRASHLAYIAAGQNVFAYRINKRTGSSAAIIGSPFITGASPSSVVVHPSNQFLYVANQADNTISLFKIDSTSGALTEVLPRTSTGISPIAMTMDSAGSFLFVADQVSNDISVFSISAGGSLSLASTASVGSNPSGLTLTSAGDFLFVPVPNFSAIYVFSVSSGSLTQVGTPFPVSGGVATLAVDPGGKFLFAPNPSVNTVSVLAIQSSGALSSTAGAFATGTAPVAATVDSTGGFLYVANFGSANLSQFKIDSTTGALTAFTTATVTAGTNPEFIFIDPNGKFVFVGDEGSRSITELSIKSDGSLTSNGNMIELGVPPRSLSVTK